MLVPGRTTLLMIAVLSAAFLAAAAGNISTRSASIYSTSPENIFMTGTHDFYSYLAQQGYYVALGSPSYIATRSYMHGKTLYVILGPDKPFTDTEAATLASLVREGKIALLVADETGNTRKLLDMLGGIEISDSLLESRVTGKLSYLVPLICMGKVIVSTKVAWLKKLPRGARVVCWAEPSPGKRYPVAALVQVGKGWVLVVSDSSIFSNFEIEGLKPFPSTRRVALGLVKLVDRHYRIHYIVFDNTHYRMSQVVRVSAFLRETIAGAIGVLAGIAAWVKNNVVAVAVATIALPLITAVLVTGLPEKPEERREELVDVKEVLKTIKTIVSRTGSK